MRTRIYEGDSVIKLKELLDNCAVDYFLLEYEYGGLLWKGDENKFLLPYTSKTAISNGFLGLFKKYKYEVDTRKLIEQYLSGEPCDFYGKGDIEVARDLYKAIKFVRVLGGEIELSVREFAVVRDIIIWKESGNGRFIK